MKTIHQWVGFAVFFSLSLALDMASSHPEIRGFFTHIERGQTQRVRGEITESEALAVLAKKYPDLRVPLETHIYNVREKEQQQEKVVVQEQKKKAPEKLPLI